MLMSESARLLVSVSVYLSLVTVTGCSREGVDSERSVKLLAFASATGDTASLQEIVVGSIGQSNNCGMNVKPTGFPHSLTGDHVGATLIRNGSVKSEYPTALGPDPWIIDELINVGYLPEQITLVARCSQGAYIEAMRDTLVPALELDISSRGLPAPTFLFLWQGEADARVEDEDRWLTYSDNLNGTAGGYSFLDAVYLRWPDVRLSVIELAVVSTNYAPSRGQAAIRRAHHESQMFKEGKICTTRTGGATFLPGSVNFPDDNPHTDLISTEAIARRVVHSWTDPYCP